MPGPNRTYGPETAAQVRSLFAAHGASDTTDLRDRW